MFALFGLMALVVSLAVVVLPFWSFIRVVRLSREVAALRARLDALGAASARAGTADAQPPSVGPAVDTARPAAVAEPATAPVPPVVEALPRPEPVPPVEEPGGIDMATPTALEAWVGGRWLLYAGLAILLIGVSFFLKYAFDNAWIDERGRVVLGGLVGLALVAFGRGLATRVPAFGTALTGAGIAVLYLSVYAAFDFYALIGARAAFGAMVATTALATWLADRAGAQSLALIAATGGYATPLLIESGNPTAPIVFSYVLLLTAGVTALTRRHRWLVLPVGGYLLTLATLGVWASRYYSDGEWPTVLAFVTALCAVFLAALRFVRRQDGAAAAVAAVALWSAPVVYHVVAVALTIQHPPAIHVYLILFTVVALLLTSGSGGAWTRLPVLLAADAALFAFLEWPRGGSWLVPDTVTAVAIAGLHLVTLIDRATRQQRVLETGDLVVLHATLIGVYGLLSEVLGPAHPRWPGGVAAGLAIVSAGLWRFFERPDPVAALNAAGLSFTLVAIALAARFEGAVVVIGWAVEGAVAAWFGLRAPNTAFRFGGLALFGLAAVRLADIYEGAAPPAMVVWNSRSATTLVVIVLSYVLARCWRRQASLPPLERLVPIAMHLLASAFTLLWMSTEIEDYWHRGRQEPGAALSEELARSLAWGAYGSVLIAVGMWRQLVSLRWIGIAVIGLTVLKVFVVDLSQLAGIYRVVGFLVLGALLVAVSYLYQRARAGQRPPGSAPANE